MRQIGTLPETDDPKVLGDYLLSLGVTSRAVRSREGWDIWVHNEDQVSRAREVFTAYQNDPDDPRFRAAASAAEEVRRRAERLDRQYRKNVRDLSGTFGRVPLHRRPLTVALIAVCVALFLAERASPRAHFWVQDRLWFFSIRTLVTSPSPAHGLDDIAVRHEFWRLITPIFLHGNLLHLLMNSWVVLIEGTAIETRRGSRALLALVLVSAVVSNVGEFLYQVEFRGELSPWVGISGVAFALLGYIWMKGVHEPEQGLGLRPGTVRLMLLWLVLGFMEAVPGIRMANGAHVAGLVAGMLFGLARV